MLSLRHNIKRGEEDTLSSPMLKISNKYTPQKKICQKAKAILLGENTDEEK